MATSKEALNLSDKQVEKVINDFMEHLYVAGICFYDKVDKYELSYGFVLENYMATFN
jgi:hypothetical protein